MMLDVTDRLIVLVGGGAVAARKAEGVILAGATRVRVVAPVFQADFPALVQRVVERYLPEHLEGAGLVFAATDDPAVNEAIVEECRRRGVLVCRADNDEDRPGDFSTPAIYREGSLVVSVSAGSAALAARVRDGVAKRLDPRWMQMARVMQAVRPAIRRMDLPIARRREIFRDLAGDEALDILSAGVPALWGWLQKRYPELACVACPPSALS